MNVLLGFWFGYWCCLLTIVLSFVPQSALAQPIRLADSLRKVVEQASNDTARISALCHLSEALAIVEGKDSLARIEANKAVRLAEQLSSGKYQVFAPYYRALTLQALGTTYRFAIAELSPIADPYFQKAMKEAEQIHNAQLALQMQASIVQAWFTKLRFRIQLHHKGDMSVAELRRKADSLLSVQQAIAEKLNSNALRGRILLNRAIVLTDTLTQRLLLCLESVRRYEQSPDIRGLTSALEYLGYYADEIGDYPRAIQAFKRAMLLHDSAQIELRGLTVCYQSLGDIYTKLCDTAKALEFYHRAEPYSERYDVRFNRIELLFNIAMLYRGLGKKDTAQTYFERAMLISRERNDGYDLLRSAQIYRLQGDFRAALGVLALSLREVEKLSPQLLSYDIFQELVLTYKAQAYYYKSIQPTLYRAALDSALNYAKQCLPLLLDERYKVGSAERFVTTYTLLYELSKEAGESQNALYYHEKREYWKEKTLSSETYRAIAAMESRAVVEAIEAKVETLEARERLQRAVTLAVGIAALAFVSVAGLLAWRFQERKRSSERLQRKNEQLQALNQEKNELMGIVAHDLKNPIGAIRGFAELLQSDNLPRDYFNTAVEQISLTSDRMLDFVKNLLDSNQLDEGGVVFDIVPCPVEPVLAEIIHQYTPPAQKKNIHIHLDLLNQGVLCLADEQAMMQVLDNLVSNAVKYSPQGKNIFVRLKSSPDAVRVEVQDEGPGISEEDMKKLFGKFARLSARPTGGEHSTGLGLSIVKKMVEAMNGRVWCESELGRGATFIVELPTPV